MLKLYRFSAEAKEFWETWEEEPGRHLVHWGELGTKGQTKVVASKIFRPAEGIIQKEVDTLVAAGFAPIPPEEHTILMIEYSIDGMGTQKDLEKRHRLEDRMNETLGWMGLGATDGGSSGSGTMEVCTFVVDFDVAKKAIEDDLADTEFADFSRIYREDD